MFQGVHEILARGNAVPWQSPTLHDPRKAPECLHMTAKSWSGSVGAEHSATGNVKPRKPQGGFLLTWPLFFFGRYLYIFVIDIPQSLYVIMRFERPCQAR